MKTGRVTLALVAMASLTTTVALAESYTGRLVPGTITSPII